ncbi:MAG TPA: adenylate kinase [Anaerolineales bacterium]|jgi:adenylate kinase|nr:adenylate kinase [Anaerolineales bacterium]
MEGAEPVFVVLLGAPGAGKGTQAKYLAKAISVPHVSSGDIFRENLTLGSELGKQASDFLARGELVPDDITIAMMRDRLARSDCAPGAILDGFPRTPNQAVALDELLAERNAKVGAALYIKVDEELLIQRLSGRWMCREAGHVYHQMFNPPKTPGVCDVDGSQLYQRQDDSAETVAHRIKVYLRQTAPVIEHYRARGQIIEIDGGLPIEEVCRQALTALPERGGR